MRFVSYLVKDMPPALYRQACSLTLRDSGYAQGHFRAARKAAHQYTRVVLALSGRRVDGWGLMVQCMKAKRLSEYSINFYVRASARGHGIGGILFRQVAARLRRTKSRGHVCIWSDESNRFYSRYRSSRVKRMVSPRYKGLT